MQQLLLVIACRSSGRTGRGRRRFGSTRSFQALPQLHMGLAIAMPPGAALMRAPARRWA